MAMPLVSVLSPSKSSQWVRESAATVLWTSEGNLGSEVDVLLERRPAGEHSR